MAETSEGDLASDKTQFKLHTEFLLNLDLLSTFYYWQGKGPKTKTAASKFRWCERFKMRSGKRETARVDVTDPTGQWREGKRCQDN